MLFGASRFGIFTGPPGGCTRDGTGHSTLIIGKAIGVDRGAPERHGVRSGATRLDEILGMDQHYGWIISSSLLLAVDLRGESCLDQLLMLLAMPWNVTAGISYCFSPTRQSLWKGEKY